jgi:hypothetical protein
LSKQLPLEFAAKAAGGGDSNTFAKALKWDFDVYSTFPEIQKFLPRRMKVGEHKPL